MNTLKRQLMGSEHVISLKTRVKIMFDEIIQWPEVDIFGFLTGLSYLIENLIKNSIFQNIDFFAPGLHELILCHQLHYTSHLSTCFLKSKIGLFHYGRQYGDPLET